MEVWLYFSQIQEWDLFHLIGLIVNNVEIVFEIHLSSQQMLRLLLRHIYVFSICLVKKTEFLEILQKYISKNKIQFSLKKKRTVPLNKSYFCLSNDFQNWLHDTDHILYYPQMSVFSFHTFLLSYISFQKTEHRNNVNQFLFIKLAKVQQQNESK